ncbi:hypothetical protein [Salinirubrum litoreum]|uniref:SipW-cognate class signal peptide n=1 Tax=Salinirubrum litoreum TaxID=1126234 RepID=A0ABD5RD13_9EURY|nr:hypothetical protein [Salinirubrum litoreum]
MQTTPTRRPTRREVLAGAGAVGIACLGAGFGALGQTTPDQTETTFDLQLDYRLDPTPTDSPVPIPNSSGPTSPSDTSGDDRSRRRRRRTPTPTPEPRPTPPGRLVGVTLPPTTLSDLHPGDAGTLSVDLRLVGGPARLWLRADAGEFTEGGLVEPERTAGDDTAVGELQSHLRVTLWLDSDGDGLLDADESVFYDGPAEGLGTLAEGVPLVDDAEGADDSGCLTPGTYPVALRWYLPTDAPNTVQTDGLSLALDFAGTDCGVAGAPFPE